MFTILGGDGKPYGPVPADQIRAWIAAGRANLETSARREGDPEWRPLGEYPEFAPQSVGGPPPMPTFAPPAPGFGGVPALPGAAVYPPPGYGGPAPSAGFRSEAAGPLAADLLARAGRLDVMGCYERGLALYKGAFGPILGTSLLIMLLLIVGGSIPFVGAVVSLLFTGVILGGLYRYLLLHARGQPATLSDAFAGFQLAFGQLILVSLVSTLLIYAAGIPGIAVIVGAAIGEMYPLIVLGALLVLPMFYLGVAYMFAVPLVIDQRLTFWTAMELSRRVATPNWWRILALTLLGGVLYLLGLIALIVGVLFVLPLIFCAFTVAYQDLFCPAPRPPGA